MGKLILVIGGARSGKSKFAQELATKLGDRVTYIATAQPGDDEMAARISRHRRDRPQHWDTVEVTSEVDQVVREIGSNRDALIIDCLTLLVSNLLLSDVPEDLEAEAEKEREISQALEQLTEAARQIPATTIVVSNEVGMGLVPDNRLGRIFRDLAGRANQLLAQRADEVYLVVAGLPRRIK